MDEYDNYKHALLVGCGLTNKSVAEKISSVTKELAMEDYQKLRDIPCKGINQKSLIGNRVMNYYFLKHRINTKSKKGVSFMEFLKKGLVNTVPSYKRLYQYGIKNKKTDLVSKYDVFRMYFGSIQGFKPLIAKMLYCKYKPKTILDFSAGWGGRALGAMALDINYIGFDTNKDLQTAYGAMIKECPHDSNVKIHFQDSSKVDYSKYNYDMVFTSPPYYMKTKPTEGYKFMPEYKDREDFNQRFFFPVVEKTWKHLQSGGTYALNIPMDMYDDLKKAKLLPKLSKKIPLFIQPRFSNKAVQERSGQTSTYKEYIYIWKK
jgi:tRNA1(Val) A37 N6-methylase TrmN6